MMIENKKITLEDVNNIEDLSNWINNVEWDSKTTLYNKGNQEQYSKMIANSIEKIKMSKDEIVSLLDNIINKSNDETKNVVYFILCLSNQHKYCAVVREFLVNYTNTFISDNLIEELKYMNKNFSENSVSKYVKRLYDELTFKNHDITAHDTFLLIISIIKLFNNSINRMYKDKNTIIIEREMVEFYYEKFNKNDDIRAENYVAGDIMGQQVKDETFVKNLIKYVYLYNGLSEKIELLEIANQNLIDDKNSLSYKIANMNNIIESLNEQLTDKDNQILAINNELSQARDDRNKAENRLGFEKNKYEQGFLSMQANLLDSLKSDLQLEIEGIEDIIESLPDEKKAKILRRLRRIEKVIDERLGG